MNVALSTDQVKQALKNNHRWHDEFLRSTPTRDLLDRLEAWQFTRLEEEGESHRSFCEVQIDGIRAELGRRRKLLAGRQSDAYAPSWPASKDREGRLRERVEAVKQTWPLDRFCSQVLWCDLKPTSGGRQITSCPFPDHQDDSPSFVLYPDGHAHCFGCQRGGDIITLAEIYFKCDRFIDALKTVEALSPIGRVA